MTPLPKKLLNSSSSSVIKLVATYISAELRAKIEQVDRGRCCYCLIQEINSGIALSFDHILPQSRGDGLQAVNTIA